VKGLLTDENVVAIYQHGRHEKRWLRIAAARFRSFHVVGCECTSVGMLFVTKSASRAKDVHRSLVEHLGAARQRAWLLSLGQNHPFPIGRQGSPSKRGTSSPGRK
jgi:hypothetical protein